MEHELSNYREPVTVSSLRSRPRIELGVTPAPPATRQMLPDRYGLPLFEFLVVDPANAFVSWEITPQQLSDCQLALGETLYATRRLQVEVYDGAELICQRELFGEVGRWFLPLSRAGFRAVAKLGFQHAEGYYELATAGPLPIPRTEVVECTEYEELTVDYGTGSSGQLTLSGLNRDTSADWPGITLPAADTATLAELQQAELAAQAGHAGWPSSPTRRPTSLTSGSSSLSRPTSPGWGARDSEQNKGADND